jgi:2',3'-cyclic-nucleotide 2'-phosphodiesterase (5'-nucleotidase family)
VYEIAPLSGGQYGGMARVAHVRDSVAGANHNTYLFMAGDFLNPSLLGTIKVDGERLNGKHMVDVMNAMNFDLVTFGNHEFDVGEKALQKRLNESNFQWTSANVRQINENGKGSFKIERDIGNIPVKDTYVISVEDKVGTMLKIGFFSVTTPANPVDFVAYGDIYAEAKRAYNSLVNNVDFVVGLTHLTIDEDKKLAESLPGVPLIMGGHEHNNMLVPINNTVIAKADANAKSIYIHTLSYNKNSRKLKIDSYLMPIDNRTASKPEVAAKVSKWNEILDRKIKEVIEDPDEVIYKSDIPLDGTDSANRGIQTNLGDLLTASMAMSFNERVDAAIVNGGSIRIDDMLPNEVTSLDIFRVLPFGGSVIWVDITGRLLIDVLDFGKTQGGTGAYLQRYNIAESDIAGWMIKRKPIRVKDTYRIAMSDFLLKGLDIPFLNEDNPGILKVYHPLPSEPASDIRKAVIVYLKSLIPQDK